jgi:mRNA interferase MazF
VRGAVYRLRHSRDARGHEQAGDRYGVVVLASRFSHLSRWLVIPTSTRARPAVYRPSIEVAGQSTFALCDALNAVDPEHRLNAQVDYLSDSAMREIDWSLALLLDLPTPPG